MSPKTRDIEACSPSLAILDGIDPLRSWEMTNTQNILILLDRMEYDQEAEDILYTFANHRIEIPELFRNMPAVFPSGVEASFYAFKEVT